MASKGSGSGTKKYGRDSKKCQKYRTEGRKEKNKTKHAIGEEKRQAKFKARKEKRQEEHKARIESLLVSNGWKEGEEKKE